MERPPGHPVEVDVDEGITERPLDLPVRPDSLTVRIRLRVFAKVTSRSVVKGVDRLPLSMLLLPLTATFWLLSLLLRLGQQMPVVGTSTAGSDFFGFGCSYSQSQKLEVCRADRVGLIIGPPIPARKRVTSSPARCLRVFETRVPGM